MMGLNRQTSATRGRLLACLAGALAAGLAMAGPTLADYKITSIISLPGGQKITSFDIVVTEPTLSLLAFTDRAQKSVDVFDTTTNTLLFESGGFIGVAPAGTTDSGPNGVIFVGAAKSGSGHLEIWAGDGDSTVKVVDFTTKTVIKTIASGGSGKTRVDEGCYDPVDDVVVFANDRTVDDFIAFYDPLTYTKTKTIKMDGTGGAPLATNGIEQCQWNPRTGLFYVAIPEVSGPGNDSVPGTVLVINPVTKRIVAGFTIPLDACAGPQGLSIGPAPQILLGCSANGPSTAIINELDGSVIASFPGLNGNDEVYFNPTDNHYFLAESGNPKGPQLGIIDALTLKAAASVPTATGSHTVAADPSTGQVYVGVTNVAGNTICSAFGGVDANGCILVLTSVGGATSVVSAILPNARTTVIGKPVTAFATIINSGAVTAVRCSLQRPAGIAADFLYQTTDPVTNTPTGTANTPVNIAAGKSQSFFFAVTPTQSFSQDIPIVAICDNSDPAPTIGGLNTFLVSATDNTPAPDMLEVSATPGPGLTVALPSTTGVGFFTVASLDIGAVGVPVTFVVTDTPIGQPPRNIPVSLSICQTAGAGCLATPSSFVTVTPAAGGGQAGAPGTTTFFFTVFVSGLGTAIANNPGFNRIFVIAYAGGLPVGETSAGVRTP